MTKHILKDSDKIKLKEFLRVFRDYDYFKEMPELFKKEFIMYSLFYIDWISIMSKEYFMNLTWSINKNDNNVQLKQKSLSDYLFASEDWRKKNNSKMKYTEEHSSLDDKTSQLINNFFTSASVYLERFNEDAMRADVDEKTKDFMLKNLQWELLLREFLYPMIESIHPIARLDNMSKNIKGINLINLEDENKDRKDYLQFLKVNKVNSTYEFYKNYEEELKLDKYFRLVSWL